MLVSDELVSADDDDVSTWRETIVTWVRDPSVPLPVFHDLLTQLNIPTDTVGGAIHSDETPIRIAWPVGR